MYPTFPGLTDVVAAGFLGAVIYGVVVALALWGAGSIAVLAVRMQRRGSRSTHGARPDLRVVRESGAADYHQYEEMAA